MTTSKVNSHPRQRTAHQRMPVWMIRKDETVNRSIILDASRTPHDSRSSMVNEAIRAYQAFERSAKATGMHRTLRLVAPHAIAHDERGGHVLFNKGHATVKVRKDGRTTIMLSSSSELRMNAIKVAASGMQNGVW